MTEQSERGAGGETSAQGWVDEVTGSEVDWRGAVRQYPLPTLALAALGGFFLGRRYGWQLVEDVSGYVAGELIDQLQGALEGGLSGERR